MSVRAAGRALFVVLMLCSAFDATLPFLLFAERDHNCSCPIKAPCCKGPVCPMDAARRHAEGLSLRSCGAGGTRVALPNFLRWMLLMPLPAGREPLVLLAEAPSAVDAAVARGVERVADHPPRLSFLPIA
jgi:hypothetical protein